MSLSSIESPINTKELEDLLKSEGFENFGFAELTRPVSIEIYETWLQKGYQADMQYLERHLPEKRDPQKVLNKAVSAIVVTLNYVPHPESLERWPLSKNTRVASYARGRDYHHIIHERLGRVIRALKSRFPDDDFLTFADSGPVLERDLAARAGLGWIGKNTCLIDRKKGSLFFIAEIYTSLLLPAAKWPHPDHCGTCTRCIDACPTGAIVAEKVLDARKCISYLTIESRKNPPTEIRHAMGDWLFGCDICQTVCPWNIKALGPETIRALDPVDSAQGRLELINDLRFLLTSGNRALERAFQGTPLMRAGGNGLKRNALVVAANRKAYELKHEIQELITNPKLGELAKWALKEIESQDRN